ncbi:MAG TPA: hypothetical protein VNX00_06590, partial [Herbaspirillum sp.]|nr:hypothetical protein [Herbaspirillum sp.]
MTFLLSECLEFGPIIGTHPEHTQQGRTPDQFIHCMHKSESRIILIGILFSLCFMGGIAGI